MGFTNIRFLNPATDSSICTFNHNLADPIKSFGL